MNSRESPASTTGIWSLLGWAAARLRPYWHLQATVVGTTLVDLGFALAIPWSYGLLIDRAILTADEGQLVAIVGAIAGLFLFGAASRLTGSYVAARLGASLATDIRIAMFDHLQRLSMDFYSRTRVGDLLSRLASDVAVVQSGIVGAVPGAVYVAILPVASTAFLLILDWRLALITIGALSVFVGGPWALSGSVTRASYELQRDAAAVASDAQENIQGQRVIKSFGLERAAVAAFGEKLLQMARRSVRLTFLTSLMGTSASLAAGFVEVLTLIVGAFLVIKGNVSLGTLVTFLVVLDNMNDSLARASDVTGSLHRAVGGARRIRELLDERVQVQDAPSAQRVGSFSGELAFNNVHFEYRPGTPVLNGVTFSVRSGQTVAFVGPSGAGKTTVLNLVVRFYDPTSGSVTVDGHDLRRITQRSLRDQLGLVAQDDLLFNTSIRENIRMGRPGATDQEVEAAARNADVHDAITSFADGYDTVVGERGARLSGGERQRIAIARAMVREPALLLLDEATSSVDAASEGAIDLTLERLGADRTVLRVSHRLGPIANADRIFVMDRGRIVEQGTHHELLALGGLYTRLWRQQHRPAAVGG